MTLLANGFLPTRGTFVLDAVFISMIVICCVMLISIFLVRTRKHFRLHRNIQLGLTMFLVVVITLFEIEIRLNTDWRSLAIPSRYYANGVVGWALAIHLLFAIPTPLVWAYVVIQAMRRISLQSNSDAYRQSHRYWGWIAASMMLLTVLSACLFYWLAFAC